MADSSLWSGGRADDHITQQQFSPLLFAPTVIWSQLSWGLGSTIHKYQAAFSSIVIVMYKVHALHFLTQPQGSSPLWPCPCRSHTALDFLFYPPTSPLAQQRSLRSYHGCCLSAPPAASCVTAKTPALLASSAHLQSDGTNKGDQYRNQTLFNTERLKERYTWTWGGALNTNVTALAMSSAFKHWKVEKEALLIQQHSDFFTLWNTFVNSQSYVHLLSYSHTLQLLSLDRCYGAWRQTQSLLFQEIYTAGEANTLQM